jgi:uncharacterized protein YdhG (YjbR/CyaY superfamily)
VEAAMAQSKATSVSEYLDELPDDRREAITTVRQMIRNHLPKGYEETINYGMISYHVPLVRYPNTYNGQPLSYVALAAQKNFNSLYFLGAYGSSAQRKQLEDAFKKAGKKLDMGKSCIRFRSADDLPLTEIGKLIASLPPDKWIAIYEQSRKKK